MATREEITRAIAQGNLTPKMFSKFFEDMKIKAFSYDYRIQRELVDYCQIAFDYSDGKSMIGKEIFEDGKWERVLEFTVNQQFINPGERRAWKSSEVFNKPLSVEKINSYKKLFKYNVIAFVDGVITTNFRIRAFEERTFIYFRQKDIIAIHTKQMALKKSRDDAAKAASSTTGNVSTTAPVAGTTITDPTTGTVNVNVPVKETEVDSGLPKKVTILFIPDSVVSESKPLKPFYFNGRTITTDVFTANDKFRYVKNFMGFWVNNETDEHFMISDIKYDKDRNKLYINDDVPANVNLYHLVVVGIGIVKEVKDVSNTTKWIGFGIENMPLPKDDIMVFIKSGNTYIPNDGTVALKEYYPNIYEINNPNAYDLRFIALYENSSQNEHISYDRELDYYLQVVDLLDTYTNNKVPDVVKEFNPVNWDYNLDDYFKKNNYDKVNMQDKWNPLMYKMNTISAMMKLWCYFFMEYERRTYGFLTGWYHDISKYDNMKEKIRYDTAKDIPASSDILYHFDKPQYVFIYKNDTEFGSANSFSFYIDGRFVIPTQIVVYRGYQYVYLPVSLIKDDSMIEVERFDGVQFNREIKIPESGAFVHLDFLKSNIIANALFITDVSGNYLDNGQYKIIVVDTDAEYEVDSSSVFVINPTMKLRVIPSKKDYANQTIVLHCNNKCVQYVRRVTGTDFSKDDVINFNTDLYIHRIKRPTLSRLRIYNEDGRMFSKRSYTIYKHDKYFDAVKFSIPIKPGKDLKLRVSYIGYDERLIYHLDDIPNNGLISIEGKTSRPISLTYHDVYVDGIRLTKRDIMIIAPFHFVITSLAKLDTLNNLEIYEKSYPEDSMFKFEIDEDSQYIMDKIFDKDKNFHDKVVDSLPIVDPSGKVDDLDDLRDWFYDFFRDWYFTHFVNGDLRYDLEAYHGMFSDKKSCRILFNADDRVRYELYKNAMMYMWHDKTLLDNGGVNPTDFDTRYDELEGDVPKPTDVTMNEYDYIRGGYHDENYKGVIDNTFEPYVDPGYKPTDTHTDALPAVAVNPDSIKRPAYTPKPDDPTDRYDPDKPHNPSGPDTAVFKMQTMYPDTYQTMVSVPDKVDTSKVTSMNYAFGGCKALTKIPDELNTSLVTDMGNMFYNCQALVNIKALDTTNVLDMSGMFNYCVNLQASPNLDTSNVTKMVLMFSGDVALTTVPTYNTINVTDFGGMFNGCTSLTSVQTFNMASALSTYFMFAGCTKLATVPELVTHKLTDMSYMFTGCTSLPEEFPWVIDCAGIKSIDKIKNIFTDSSVKSVKFNNVASGLIGQFISDNLGSQLKKIVVNGNEVVKTLQLTDTTYKMCAVYPLTYDSMKEVPEALNCVNLSSTKEMFTGCIALEKSPAINSTHASDMSDMFISCSKLATVGNIDSSNASDMSEMFANCVSITTGPMMETKNVAKMSKMFSGCTSLKDIPKYNTINVVDFTSMFDGDTALVSLPLLDTSKAIKMPKMFNGCITIPSVPDMITSSVTDMSSMFNGCAAISTIPQFNTGKVMDMSFMFNGCVNLESIPSIETSRVIKMTSMFNGCSKLTSIPQFDVSSVEDMSNILNGCTELTALPKLNTKKVTSFESAFAGCTKLADVPYIDTSKATNMTMMFSGDTALPTEFPWQIDCSSLTSVTNISGIFGGTDVKIARFVNVKTELTDSFINDIIGGSLRHIFVNGVEVKKHIPVTDTYYKACDIYDDASTMVMAPNIFECDNLTTAESMFAGCAKLAETPELNSTNHVTNMSNMFSVCSELLVGPVLNTDSVKNMAQMYNGCSKLTSSNMGNAPLLEDAHDMFGGCSELESSTISGTTNLVNMAGMFASCTKLASITEFSTAKVTNMTGAFFDCKALPAEFPWTIDCSAITDISQMTNMFAGSSVNLLRLTNVKSELIDKCVPDNLGSGIKRIFVNGVEVHWPLVVTNDMYKMSDVYPTTYQTLTTIPDVLDTKRLTTMDGMFMRCVDLITTPDMSTSQVTSMENTFANCENIQTTPLYETQMVTDMISMFDGCRSITTVPEFDTGKVVKMDYMFRGCNSLKTVPNFNSISVVSMNGMFKNCGEVTKVQLNTNSLTSSAFMFSGCSKITEVSLTSTAKITDMSEMFRDCKALIMIPTIDCSSIVNMSNMFMNCYLISEVKFIHVPVEMINKLTHNYLDAGTCTYKITIIKDEITVNTDKHTMVLLYPTVYQTMVEVPNKLNTSAVTDMSNMFAGCTQLRYIEDFNSNKVTNMSNMFLNCTNLKSVPVFNTALVTDMHNMFAGCTSLHNDLNWEIDCSAITDTSQLTNIVANSSIRILRLKNVNAEIAPSLKLDSKLLTNGSTLDALYINGLDASKETLTLTDTKYMMSDVYPADYQSMTSVKDNLVTSTLTVAADMFAGCTNLTTVPLIDTSSVTNMNRMYKGCGKVLIDNVNVSFAACTTSAEMFESTSVSLELHNSKEFATSKVVNMQGMFSGVKVTNNSVITIDLNSAQPINVVPSTNLKSLAESIKSGSSKSTASSVWMMFAGVSGLSEVKFKNVSQDMVSYLTHEELDLGKGSYTITIVNKK